MFASEWPAMAEAGAGLSDAEDGVDAARHAPGERARTARYHIVNDIRRRPMVYFGFGVLIGFGLGVLFQNNDRDNLHGELRA
ncbi:MAG: hypothetical protein CGW95_10365 [Phenylobacterium zucineum]|nr:MAG: hypothetical protein CGW95_10365 [Phenylobacterium zucineum]